VKEQEEPLKEQEEPLKEQEEPVKEHEEPLKEQEELVKEQEEPESRPIVSHAMKGTNSTLQADAPWGLCRVSSKKFSKGHSKYIYPNSAGSGIDVYVIDTGINVDHHDFDGRAKWGITIPKFDQDADRNGHGTHCAGIIGGRSHGIAKNVNLIAVKVLRSNGYGTTSDVVAGVEWVVNQSRVAGRRGKSSVANMSLGGGKSMALDRAIESAVASGVHFAVAAGNDAADACLYSPAGVETAISVGAMNVKNSMAYFSNFGACVDIFAPGVDILSTWIGSPDAVNTISGTSMASPHVAGVMALYLAENEYTPEELKKVIIEDGLASKLEGIPDDTVNLLLSTHALLKSKGLMFKKGDHFAAQESCLHE